MQRHWFHRMLRPCAIFSALILVVLYFPANLTNINLFNDQRYAKPDSQRTLGIGRLIAKDLPKQTQSSTEETLTHYDQSNEITGFLIASELLKEQRQEADNVRASELRIIKPTKKNEVLTKHSISTVRPITSISKSNFPFEGACIPSPPVCSESSLRVVPNRVHYVWFHKAPEQLLFYQYLSMLSVIKFHVPEEIWFWHDTLPTGNLWQNITATIETRNIKLRLKQVEAPKTIFNITVSWIEHASDWQRLLAILQYGGIYLDFDVVVLRSLTPLMCHKVVLGRQSSEGLCNSFIMGSPGAPFLRLWYEEYKTYNPTVWALHNVHVPHLLSVAHPGLLHVEQECLQHPAWEDYERKYLFESGQHFDWSNNYIIHGWGTITKDILRKVSPTSILSDNYTVAEIYYYIYYGSIRTAVV